MNGASFTLHQPGRGQLRMSLPQSTHRQHAIASRPTDPLEAIWMFKQGRDPVPAVMRRLVGRLERAGIPYAVMGGMAVYAHGHQRMTNAVDVLLTGAGLEEFCRLFVPKYYEQDPV